MKRLWIAAAIITLLAVLAGAHASCLRGLTQELDALLEEAGARVSDGDWSGAESLTRQALEEWEGSAFYLHSTLRHEDIDDVLTAFHETLAFLEGQERQPAEYASANARLRVRIGLLLEAELPSLKNIL